MWSFTVADKKTDKATDCGESHVVLEMGYLTRPETFFPPILF